MKLDVIWSVVLVIAAYEYGKQSEAAAELYNSPGEVEARQLQKNSKPSPASASVVTGPVSAALLP